MKLEHLSQLDMNEHISKFAYSVFKEIAENLKEY